MMYNKNLLSISDCGVLPSTSKGIVNARTDAQVLTPPQHMFHQLCIKSPKLQNLQMTHLKKSICVSASPNFGFEAKILT